MACGPVLMQYNCRFIICAVLAIMTAATSTQQMITSAQIGAANALLLHGSDSCSRCTESEGAFLCLCIADACHSNAPLPQASTCALRGA